MPKELIGCEILVCHTIDGLNKQIAKKMKEGWEVGGKFIARKDDNDNDQFLHPILKFQEIKYSGDMEQCAAEIVEDVVGKK